MNHNFNKATELMRAVHMEITHLYHCTVGREWEFDNHSAEFNRIYFVLDGHGCISNEHERVELMPYHIYIVPSGGRYNYRCDEYMEKLFVHFTLSVIPHKDLLSNFKKISVLPISRGEMEDIKNTLYTDSVGAAFWFQTYIRSLVNKTLELCDEEIEKDLSLYSKYDGIYKYIENHLFADTTVKDICSSIGFSQTYIGQKFKADTGQTIKGYLMDCLTERIKYLLWHTRMPIKDISNELHFGGEFYCSKFFKKHTGVTPSEYRNIKAVFKGF